MWAIQDIELTRGGTHAGDVGTLRLPGGGECGAAAAHDAGSQGGGEVYCALRLRSGPLPVRQLRALDPADPGRRLVPPAGAINPLFRVDMKVCVDRDTVNVNIRIESVRRLRDQDRQGLSSTLLLTSCTSGVYHQHDHHYICMEIERQQMRLCRWLRETPVSDTYHPRLD